MTFQSVESCAFPHRVDEMVGPPLYCPDFLLSCKNYATCFYPTTVKAPTQYISGYRYLQDLNFLNNSSLQWQAWQQDCQILGKPLPS